MTLGQEKDSSINDELFHLYTEYQLCKVKKNRPSLWNADDTEKNALIRILTQCQQINGDTLRLVMNDIFENSVAKYADNNGAMVVHQTPHTSASSGKTPQVIMNTTTQDNEEDTDSEASKEPVTSVIYTNTHYLSSSSGRTDTAAVSRRNILPSSIPRRGPSEAFSSRQEIKTEKQKHEEQAMENQIIREQLSKGNNKAMARMVSQVEQTKAMLRQRIYTINDSFIVSLSSTIKGTFSVLSHGSCPDTTEMNMYRCQENWIGYRFGKLVERLHKEYPDWEASNKAKQYYQELQHELKRQQRSYSSTPWNLFIYYSKRVVQYVNEFGIYCLFIPEVLSPTRFKRTTVEDFVALMRYVDRCCSVFRDIAKLDRQGNIIAPHKGELSESRVMYKKTVGSRARRY